MPTSTVSQEIIKSIFESGISTSNNNNMIRKSLVQDAGLIETIFVMCFCHLSVTFLCMNVLFDLLIFGMPLFLLNATGILNSKLFHSLTTSVINWTTPIVYGIPMVLSGTKVYVDHFDILVQSKEKDSLLLANHGSRIDWMVGMFIGHLTHMGTSKAKKCRVGFVCEALIQFMPLIGWYRKIICNDIFVWRSFEKDANTIKSNIGDFKRCEEQRMLFLSPEGVIVDHGDKDMEYVQQCRQFCIDYGYKPFEYVLTPRYKGTICLLDQIIGNCGPFVSACLVFVRDGKLLNCRLTSRERVIPDIYDLNQGITGNPVSIYIHVRKMDAKSGHGFDAKARLMEEYLWKDSILTEWDEKLKKGHGIPNELTHNFTAVESNPMEVAVNHLLHVTVMVILSMSLNLLNELVQVFRVMFFCVSITHTVGWLVSQSSMESVPFETGIKALITFITSLEEKWEYQCKKKSV